METLFQILFGQNFQYVVDLVGRMDTIEKCVFIFWLSCVVMFYSTILYTIYLVGKELVIKLFTTLKLVK